MELFKKVLNRLRRVYHLRKVGPIVAANRAGAYNPNPRTCAIVQLFNKRDNISQIVDGLRRAGFDEIVVVDDGSSDGALSDLQGLLRGKNEFIIRANDIFEIRSYDRAIDFTRAEIIALLQDDDLPPNDAAWLTSAVELFNVYPKLAVLGGRDGVSLSPAVGPIPPEGYTGEECPTFASYHSVNRRTGVLKSSFSFVQTVNRAPMWVRRSAVQKLGGIDQAFAPFQCDDVDLCLRAWLGGFQVGLYTTDFIRDVGLGGMRLFNTDVVPPQARKNWALIYRRYGSQIEAGLFDRLVDSATASGQT